MIELLRAQDAGDVIVTVGGTIPAQDIPELKELGVAEVFTPGAPTAGDHRLHPIRYNGAHLISGRSHPTRPRVDEAAFRTGFHVPES